MSDGLVALLGLVYGMAAGPSNSGTRKDGKICTAQPGECRHNHKYYTAGMRDAKSWSDPCADENCPDSCPYLSEDPRDMGDEESRRERAFGLLDGLREKDEMDRLSGALLLGSMGFDPRDFID